MFPRITAFLLIIITLLFIVGTTQADEIQDIQKQIDELNKARELSVSATKPLEGQLDSLKRQLAQIQVSLDNLSANITKKQAELKIREDKIVLQQVLLESRVKAYYIRSYSTSPLLVILSSGKSGDLFREITYRQAATREDRDVIKSITAEIVDLLTQKEKLEQDQKKAADLQVQVDKSAQFLGGEIKKAQAYQADLNSKIAELSAKQQSILAQRLASLNIPLSAYAGLGGGCSSDLTNGKNPGFSPGFGFFTYGVPNRVGLNQYGAKGRAEAGQSAQQILSAYYSADYTSGYNSDITIHVTGSNEYGQSFDDNWNIEEYVKHVYEMPANWPIEALKSQAIAARSYALAYTNNGGGSICPSQQCQVVKKELNDGNWQAAVDATKGVVLTNGGSPIKAWFSSTHGGFVFSSSSIGWSSTPWTKNAVDAVDSIGSFSDLQSKAYDKASPWFYCDWGSRSSYGGTAWLKSEEVADIANILMLATRDSSTREHLYQPDKSNPAGTDTWDVEKVKQELKSRGGTPFNSVSSINVSVDFGGGRTNSVNLSGDGGSVSFAATDFKTYFNLRAPGNIQLVGPLFNVETK